MSGRQREERLDFWYGPLGVAWVELGEEEWLDSLARAGGITRRELRERLVQADVRMEDHHLREEELEQRQIKLYGALLHLVGVEAVEDWERFVEDGQDSAQAIETAARLEGTWKK